MFIQSVDIHIRPTEQLAQHVILPLPHVHVEQLLVVPGDARNVLQVAGGPLPGPLLVSLEAGPVCIAYISTLDEEEECC